MAHLRKELQTPIDKGDYIVKARAFSRIHLDEDGFTIYMQEAGREESRHFAWTPQTEAALDVFVRLVNG